ncbi:hypothetical protein [Deinococcus hopiensis]|nr:hypothetical protein [Deinococcus hopiensis]
MRGTTETVENVRTTVWLVGLVLHCAADVPLSRGAVAAAVRRSFEAAFAG